MTFLCVALLALASCSKQPAPLSTEAYVWQQARTDTVDHAVKRGAAVLDGFLFHAADVSFRGASPTFRRFDASWDALAGSKRKAGIVIRIPHAENGLGSSPEHARDVTALVRSCLEAVPRGITPSEIQIDYDCPESKLALYAKFLTELKSALPGVRLTFTALPAWLRRSDFRELARSTGGYVLQVHSLTLPKAGDTIAVICDVGKAADAIHKAETIGVPFRVALPTYRCVTVLDEKGALVDVVLEDGSPTWARAAHVVPGASDPVALARLVEALKQKHSPLLEGIIWYRLPVDTDRMNWRWPTFASVIAGREPRSQLEIRLVPQPGGAAAVEIENAGESTELWPADIVVQWDAGGFEAADALGGYETKPPPNGRSCRFVLSRKPLFGIDPATTVVVGWIRVRDAAALRVSARMP